ncbi:general odorant-binding protein 19d isoform X2 [Thrips palmi]|uniref:General odorant-binding protein 19d isoform X2 n=1 Tax=Thrips palmi TaxID=161013 RepID=A0A6P8ZL57_THRPL|nr:general odorant-binding protein 19d isoform X2 [Thrips palmi]
MKVLVVLAACVLVCSAAAVDDAEREKAKQIKQQCKQEAGATDADVSELKDKDELTSPAAKKMMACVFTKNKIMQNNKFSKEGSMEVARKLMAGRPGSEAKLKIAEQIAENCNKEIGSVEASGDEMAKLIFDCLKKQAKEKIAAVKKASS